MGKIVKKGEHLTVNVQVLFTEKDFERLNKHPLIQKRVTDLAPLMRVWILERLEQEEKHSRK